MRNMLLVLVTLFVAMTGGYAQFKNFAAQEDELVYIYDKIMADPMGDFDTIQHYSSVFGEKLKGLVKSDTATLHYPFKRLNDSFYCYVNTSADGNLKIYSWDTWTGGTMHVFDQVFQFRANGKVFTKGPPYEQGDAGSFCSQIYTVPINGKTYYLVVSNGIYSTRDVAQSVTIYSIEGNHLADTAKLFKTKTKRLSSINVSYDFFSVMDRPERPAALITYDEALKILYIPVVNDDAAVTEKNILYQLKNGVFEFIGIETGKRKQ